MNCRNGRRAHTTRAVARFFADDRGATAIEYAMIASLISVAIVGAVYGLGDTIQTAFYNKIAAALSGM